MSRQQDGPTSRKATLFCPTCGHAGPVDSEWQYRSAGIRTNIDCPECDSTVAVRRPDDSDADYPFTVAVRAWNRALLTPWIAWSDAVAATGSGETP